MKKFVLLISAILICFAVFYLIALLIPTPSSHQLWKGNFVTTSEWDYNMERISQIALAFYSSWSRNREDYDNNKLLKKEIFWVIDLDHHEMWIEEQGEILPRTYFALSKNLKWSLYHQDPDGVRELKSPVYFQYDRYLDNAHTKPEFFNLHVEGDDHYATNRYSNDGTRKQSVGKLIQSKESFFMISVENDNPNWKSLNTLLKSFGNPNFRKRPTISKEHKNQTSYMDFLSSVEEWQKIEPQIYREIESLCYNTIPSRPRIRIFSGFDYRAGYIFLTSDKKDLISSKYKSFESYLFIDRLEKGIWYAKSIRPPHYPTQTKGDFEFLITDQPDRVSNQEKWLQIGRETVNPFPEEPSPWSAEMPNGIKVFFLGVCEHPSLGKKWWGLDGNLLEHPPMFNYANMISLSDETKRVEIAIQMIYPNYHKGLSHQFFFNNTQPIHKYSIARSRGRYFFNEDMRHYALSFPKDATQTTLQVQLEMNLDPNYVVEIQNIPLAPHITTDYAVEFIGEISPRNAGRFKINNP